MKEISLYIIEKLKINKESQIDKNEKLIDKFCIILKQKDNIFKSAIQEWLDENNIKQEDFENIYFHIQNSGNAKKVLDKNIVNHLFINDNVTGIVPKILKEGKRLVSDKKYVLRMYQNNLLYTYSYNQVMFQVIIIYEK